MFKDVILNAYLCFLSLFVRSLVWEHWATMAVRCFAFVIVLSKTILFKILYLSRNERMRQSFCVVILLLNVCKLQSYIVFRSTPSLCKYKRKKGWSDSILVIISWINLDLLYFCGTTSMSCLSILTRTKITMYEQINSYFIYLPPR